MNFRSRRNQRPLSQPILPDHPEYNRHKAAQQKLHQGRWREAHGLVSPVTGSNSDPRAELQAALPRIPGKDREFAECLLATARPSEKQLHWMGVLARRAGPVVTVDGAHIGIREVFARSKAKAIPRLYLHVADDLVVRLNRRDGGEIDVRYGGRVGRFGSRPSFGRISSDDRWIENPHVDVPPGIPDALRRFATDPLKVAAEYGRIHGSCCFCGRDLTSAESKRLGYGPICARQYVCEVAS